MSNKVIFVALSVLLIFHDGVVGKKSRRKRPQAEEENAYPQPSVLTYSNFGFNDVGSYDGFVPSSPDYASFLRSNGGKEESTTRLYAPAFPTAMDGSSGYSNDFGSHSPAGQSFQSGSDGQQLGLFHLEPNAMNTFGSMNTDITAENKFSSSDSNRHDADKYKMPIYGAKIGMKTKTKSYQDFSDTHFKELTTETTTLSNEKNIEKFYKSKKRHQYFDGKQTSTEPSHQNHQNAYNIPNYPTTAVEPFMKTSFNTSTLLNFPRVVDFTNIKPYFPNDLEGNYPIAYGKPLQPVTIDTHDMMKPSSFNDHGDHKNFKLSSSMKNSIDYKDEKDKRGSKLRTNLKEDGVRTQTPSKFKGTVTDVEYKDKPKIEPWNTSENNVLTPTDNNNRQQYNNNGAVSSSKFINYNDDKSQTKSMNGYQYSTNHSSTSFKYDFDEPKKPFEQPKQPNSNVDEIVPASSDISISDYQFPNTDFSEFNKIPNFRAPIEESDLSLNSFNSYKPSEDYLNRFKNLYTTTPISTSNWGSIFKSTDYSLNKYHKKRPQFGEENLNDDIVHIPKRPSSFQSYKYGKKEIPSIDNPGEFQYHTSHRPYRPQRPQFDWNNEQSNTRFKSEEDLLGLRTKDTLRPSYLPNFGSTFNEVADENNYKRLIEQWRTDYLRAKQKEAFNDYESYASDTKPVHVPVPKPYPIEVPHPVIVPVPQPYPVRVPVPKPVAVPVLQELMVPIEKPVPYPVVKKVPYPVEKPVPVPVEKQVPVPVMKPYPVPVPQIRPVFHHSKHHDEYNNLDDDDEYVPRPESSKRVPYAKRPKNSRNRQRRPSRTAFPERSRRRWPQHQAADSKERRYSKRPPPSSMETPFPRYRHHEREYEDFDKDERDYALRCKNGDC